MRVLVQNEMNGANGAGPKKIVEHNSNTADVNATTRLGLNLKFIPLSLFNVENI